MSQTHGGGRPYVKDLPYSKPQGPASQGRQAPGLGGTNHGTAGTQGKHVSDRETSGRPGLHGSNHGTKGTQR